MLKEFLKESQHPRRALIYCLQYVFNVIDKRALNKALGKEEAAIANRLLTNGFFLKNCKLYVYDLLKYGSAQQDYSTFGLSKRDAILLRQCTFYLRDVDTSWPSMTLAQLDACVNQLTSKSFDTYIGKFITKKLRFLTMFSFHLSRHDLKTDMICSAITAIYMTYPRFESKLHITNIAKHAIHNAGIGLISYHTKSCRNQMVKDDAGVFECRTRDIHDVVIPIIDQKDQETDVKSLKHLTNCMNATGQRLIKIASGQYDSEFSAYLNKDNEDYAQRCQYDTYLKKARDFLGVSQEEMTVFLNEVRAQL